MRFHIGKKSITEHLFDPVDAASINLFRMMFGAVMFWEVWRFFEHDWIRLYYIDRVFLFKYYGFEWVEPWSGQGMYVHFAVMGVLALCIAFGFLYRLAAALFFFGFCHWFLLDQTRYLNHLYLVCLVSFLLVLIPAHRGRSLDARWDPGLASQSLPGWCLWILRFQVFVIYFYAGLAKLNADWLRLEPIGTWLARRDHFPLIGPLLDTEVAAVFFAYGGLAFDLAVAPLLLWKPTRRWAFAACVFFHLTNKVLFDIGIFPFLALALTTLMLPPDWPRRIPLFFMPRVPATGSRSDPAVPPGKRRLVAGVLLVYVTVQLGMPLRHFLYPGNVSWTEEGHRFAWHMKLREKRAEARFVATDPGTGESWEVDQERWLSRAQRRRVGRFPDMSLQFAHFLAEELSPEGQRLEIRVESVARLNGRTPQLLFDPDVDLASEARSLAHADWILPLAHDLPRRAPRQ